MSRHSKLAMLAGASVLVMGGGVPAFAQTSEGSTGAEDANTPQLEEVTVNARRVKENLQNVPIAVQAFTEAQLQSQDVHDVFSLDSKTAAITSCCSPTSPYVITFIRGIQDVVTYFDDAPINPLGSGMFFDLENAQVLKGPQGTLFGLSSDGGAILFQPKQPGNTFGGYASAVVGDYGRRSIEGAVDLPLVDDKLLVRLGVKTYNEDGFVHDLTMNRFYENQDYQVLRAQVTFRPFDGFENRSLVNYYESTGYPFSGTLTRANPTGLAAELLGPNFLTAFQNQLARGPYATVNLPIPSGGGFEQFVHRWNVVNTTNWDFIDHLTLHNVFSYEAFKTYNQLDPFLWNINASGNLINPIPLPHQNPPAPFNRTWTEDLQIRGKYLDDKLSFVVGTYISGAHTPSDITYSNSFNIPAAALAETEGKTRAVYAQATYNLSQLLQGLSFTGGYRYTWDTREQVSQGLDPNTLAPLNDLEGSGHFSAPSYTLVLNYQLTPDIMFYLNNSKGYSSGGLQLAAPAGYTTFQPQSLNNVELGMKSTFSFNGMQLRADLAGYYGRFDNVQVQVNSLIQVSPPPAPPQDVALTENAATGRIEGLDASLSFVAPVGIELGVEFSYMHDRYTQYNTLDPVTNLPISLAGVGFIYVPDYKIVSNATYHLPFGGSLGHFSVSANYTFTPRFPGRTLPPNEIRPDQFIERHDNLDLTFDWKDVLSHTGLDASLLVQNATNNITTDYIGEFYTNLGYNVLDHAEPRQFAFRMTYSF